MNCGDSNSELDLISEGNSTEGCSSECYDEKLCEPYHLKCDILRTKRRQVKQYRVFQMTWLGEHDWLSFCVTRNRVFCFFCRKASSRGLLTFNKRGKDSFINVGFDNWKKAKERLREHEMSHLPNEALMKLKSLNNPCRC